MPDGKGGKAEGEADTDEQRCHGGDDIQDAAEGKQQQQHSQGEGENRGQLDITLACCHFLILQHRHTGQSSADPFEFRQSQDLIQSGSGGSD